jgi:hypothetical protein
MISLTNREDPTTKIEKKFISSGWLANIDVLQVKFGENSGGIQAVQMSRNINVIVAITAKRQPLNDYVV